MRAETKMEKTRPSESIEEKCVWFCSLHRVCVMLVEMVISFFNYCFFLSFVSEIPLIYLISIV